MCMDLQLCYLSHPPTKAIVYFPPLEFRVPVRFYSCNCFPANTWLQWHFFFFSFFPLSFLHFQSMLQQHGTTALYKCTSSSGSVCILPSKQVPFHSEQTRFDVMSYHIVCNRDPVPPPPHTKITWHYKCWENIKTTMETTNEGIANEHKILFLELQQNNQNLKVKTSE